jgi:hypothetical protein
MSGFADNFNMSKTDAPIDANEMQYKIYNCQHCMSTI